MRNLKLSFQHREVTAMKQITNKEYEEWQKYKAEKAKGHVLLPDTIRFIFEQLALRAGDTLSYPRTCAGLSSMASRRGASGSQTVGPVAISALGDNDILCDQFIQIIPCA